MSPLSRIALHSRATGSMLPRIVGLVRCHCQVPCGIFDDPVRVMQLKEDAATVRKAMVQINELSASPGPLALNQATRWILTKEDHAKSIISTVSEYMLCQRVKKELFETSEEYAQALIAHHSLLTAAVKTKQVVDVSACDVLDSAINEVGKMYVK
eukprot:CAMPEP_0119310430 /NCGR_PEP_ID=MMETSP1333-20130426/19412_1 /TAXON_ID=418940 /ORGANISM="Scyphosphaera apsteinii, Strain RCC1455" /LENGTH=154 /DNA_ID=CAMNT_0007314613 /DNA_START=33 /DNA_END=497 /DNA_ORIENTATION=+